MNDSSALICIPDITGFTEFVSKARLESSKKIIPSLLNKIIYANTIGLKVSEIEGDAILFFKTGELPSLTSIIDQCQTFFQDFHSKLKEFLSNEEGLGTDKSLIDKLGLKIVMHYGPVEMVKVGTHLKLIGEDVIIAHRLLKNEIEFTEYVAITKAMMACYSDGLATKNKINELVREGTDQYDHIGRLPYYYISASQLNEMYT